MRDWRNGSSVAKWGSQGGPKGHSSDALPPRLLRLELGAPPLIAADRILCRLGNRGGSLAANRLPWECPPLELAMLLVATFSATALSAAALAGTPVDPLHLTASEAAVERGVLGAPPVPDKEPWAAHKSAPADHPGATEGALSGKAVYVSQCHGWKWFDSLGTFSTQRGNLFSTVEDFHNPEGANQYLVQYLENAGARVFTVRERDLNPLMAIADNDGGGYEEEGSSFEDGAAGFADLSPWPRGVDPFGAGTTRRFRANSGDVARWTPEVPEDGVYAVYVSWDSHPDNSTDATYQITHPGGVIERSFDQTVHGSTWQYVETLWLPAGVGGITVELLGDGGPGYLSADAVRLGGGMEDVERYGVTTGRPRWESAALQYTQFNGAPSSVYDAYGDDGDPSTRSRWAAWEHPTGEPAVYLSWHSNAASGTASGTVTYIYEGSYAPVAGSSELGSLLQEELVSVIRTEWDASWNDRGVATAAFSEVNPAFNDEMPAALVELAFHDNPYDASLLKDPAFRRDASRAMMRGIVRYFAAEDGVEPVFLPEAPVDAALLHDATGELELSWAPGMVGEPWGDAPEGYVVFRSSDGRSWDDGTDVGNVTSVVLDADLGETVYARVAARNAGGLSFPSEVVGARRSPAGQAEVLVALGFDRLRESNLPIEEIGLTVGDVVRMDLLRANAFDGVVAHGEAVAAAGWFFESASDTRLADLDLPARSRVLFWNAGEEGSVDTTFTSDHITQVTSFYAAGGALWVTGAEVLWDLDFRGSEADRAFAQGVLGALMERDDAGTESAVGAGILDGIDLSFSEAAGAPYPVEYPDVLASSDGVIASYEGGLGGVAATLGERRSLFGMPFESIGDPESRAAVAAALLPALVEGYTPPEVPDDPGEEDPGDSDRPDVDTGAPGASPPPAEPQGCGCSAAPSPVTGALGLGVLGLLLRRRRR